jgi:hypothetical protein
VIEWWRRCLCLFPCSPPPNSAKRSQGDEIVDLFSSCRSRWGSQRDVFRTSNPEIIKFNEIRRPLLVRSHEAVKDHFNPAHLLVHLSTSSQILNLLVCCLVSPLPPGPPKPDSEPRRARLALLCRPTGPPEPCETSFKNRPEPPKTRGGFSKSAKMAPRDGQVGPQDPIKRVGHVPNLPRWPISPVCSFLGF